MRGRRPHGHEGSPGAGATGAAGTGVARRRVVLRVALGAVGALAAPGALVRAQPADDNAAFERAVAATASRLPGATIGVAALDTGSGRWRTANADRPMAMCSVFKLPLAAAIAARVDAGTLRWTDDVPLSSNDLVPYAPVVERLLPQGRTDVRTLVDAILEWSDNAAANLLLKRTDGPAGLTAWLRTIGDTTTRLDRTEPELNTNLPGDLRDTSTPRALVRTAQRLLLENVLSPASKEAIAAPMRRSPTGRERLRAGLPADWTVADKTGTGSRGAVNDLAIAWPPNRAPILIAMLMSGSAEPVAEHARAHRQVARLVAQAFDG